MILSLIVAVDNGNVIGKDNKLIWHLPADLKHFKNLTMGHTAIMGRKTFESIGKPLPGRVFIIITRNPEYKAEGCKVVSSMEEALKLVKTENEIFIIGGAEIFNQSMKIADKIYLTHIHHSFEGDTFFPEIDKTIWQEIKREDFSPDEKNKYNYSFIEYIRIG